MRAFRYPLQSVLNVRGLERDGCKADLAALNQALSDQRHALSRVEERIDRAMNGDDLSGKSLPPWYFSRFQSYLETERARREGGIQAVADAVAAVASGQERLTEAEMEVKKLEKHRGRLHQEWAAEQRREDNRITDEIGTVRTSFANRRP